VVTSKLSVCHSSQIIEPGIQAYTGKWALKRNLTVKDKQYTIDQSSGDFVLYPKPFGVQAEYNIGKGPRYNKLTNSVDVSNLEGGYVTLNYGICRKINCCIRLLNFNTMMVEKFEKDARVIR
jgi:hypothetical protein